MVDGRGFGLEMNWRFGVWLLRGLCFGLRGSYALYSVGWMSSSFTYYRADG